MLTVCIMESDLALGEDTHTLRLTSELDDLRVGYSKWIRRTPFAEPHLRSSVKAMRRGTPFTEGYRSGHNEAVLKTVRAQAHVGSNPTPSAKK